MGSSLDSTQGHAVRVGSGLAVEARWVLSLSARLARTRESSAVYRRNPSAARASDHFWVKLNRHYIKIEEKSEFQSNCLFPLTKLHQHPAR